MSRVVCPGKTQILQQMLDNVEECFSPMPKKILYYFATFQESYAKMAEKLLAKHGIVTEFRNGTCEAFPSCEQLGDFTDNQPTLLILDDLTEKSASSKIICDLAYRGRHTNSA